MFVHVPAAWVALFAYAAMGVSSFVSLVFRHVARGLGGPRRGRPARSGVHLHGPGHGVVLGPADVGRLVGLGRCSPCLHACLVLAFSRLHGPARQRSTTRPSAARAAEILAIVGLINLPVIKFSVDWWNTLHQGESILRAGGPLVAPVYLTPLFLVGARLHAFVVRWRCGWRRTRTEIWRRRAFNAAGTERCQHDRSGSRARVKYGAYIWPAYGVSLARTRCANRWILVLQGAALAARGGSPPRRAGLSSIEGGDEA